MIWGKTLVIRGMAIVGIAAMATGSPMVNAQQAPVHQFAVEGAGRVSCKQFTALYKDQKSTDYQHVMGFVEGYLTAANRYEPNTFDLTPWHNAVALGLILEKHCGAHPDETLVSTLQRMVTSFRPIRVASFSKLVEVGDDKKRTIVYDAVLKRSQAALRNKGLYQGPEDGIYTPTLREAFKKFQQQKSLPASGLPDPATLWTLLNP